MANESRSGLICDPEPAGILIFDPHNGFPSEGHHDRHAGGDLAKTLEASKSLGQAAITDSDTGISFCSSLDALRRKYHWYR